MNSTWTGLLCYSLLICAGKIPSSNGCLTWSVNGDNLLLICRWNNYPQTISIYDKNSVPNVICYLTVNNYFCTALLENSNITVNDSSNEITFIIQSIQETDVNGKWYCFYGNQVSETEVSLSKGIIKSTRINITAELISIGHLNEVKIKCSSCRAPRNNNAEILVNDHSVDSLTYSSHTATCVQENSKISSDKRICSTSGTIFTLVFPFIKDVQELNTSCVMQFIDNYKKSRFSVCATVYCNLKGCQYTGSITTVTKPPEDKSNVHIDPEKKEGITTTVTENTTNSNDTVSIVDDKTRNKDITITVTDDTPNSKVTVVSGDNKSRKENTTQYIGFVVCGCMITGLVITYFIRYYYKRNRHLTNEECEKKQLGRNNEDKMNISEPKGLPNSSMSPKRHSKDISLDKSTECESLLPEHSDFIKEDTSDVLNKVTVADIHVLHDQTKTNTQGTVAYKSTHKGVDIYGETAALINNDNDPFKTKGAECKILEETSFLGKEDLESNKFEEITNEQDHLTKKVPISCIQSKSEDNQQLIQEKYASEEYLTTQCHISNNNDNESQRERNQSYDEKSNRKTEQVFSEEDIVIGENCKGHNTNNNTLVETEQIKDVEVNGHEINPISSARIQTNPIVNSSDNNQINPILTSTTNSPINTFLTSSNNSQINPNFTSIANSQENYGLSYPFYEGIPFRQGPHITQMISRRSFLQQYIHQMNPFLVISAYHQSIQNRKWDNCSPCSNSGSITQSAKWCVQCEESLCEICCTYHLRMKQLSGHKTIPINKVKRRYHLDKTCTSHDEQFEYYCENHKALLCVKCLLQDHRICKSTSTINELCAVDFIFTANQHGSMLMKFKGVLNKIDRKRVTNTCREKIKKESSDLSMQILENLQTRGRDEAVNTQSLKETTDVQKKLERMEEEFLIAMQLLENAIRTMLNTIVEKYEHFLFMEEFGTRRLLFLLIKSSAKFNEDVERQIREMDSKVVDFTSYVYSKINLF